MNRRELRTALRERRAEVRRQLKMQRAQARAELAENPLVRRHRARRRISRSAFLLALLLLVQVLSRCQCDEPAPPSSEPAPEQVVEPGVPEPKKPAPKPPARPRLLEAKVSKQARGSFDGEAKAPPKWLDDFRLQVAARSTRLAQCFTGSERGGALRWTTAVNPRTGAVSDQQVEPVGQTGLNGEQRACVVKVLSEPPYRLSAEGQSLPERIGLVIEF